ncbi:crossover junction endonuclease MUS81 [Typha latifolia]|uniref:crossover junction endonuclease MUS81 n=1 Tax=Typha latifolia TaxID=4733 RepID=UPI003C30217E
MEDKRPVRCKENEEIALFLWSKRQELADTNRISDNLDGTISKAYRNICDAKTPIKTLKDLSQIKGVGQWILRLMKGFFPEASSDSSLSKNVSREIGKKTKGPKRYLPQKNSVTYALLITLYREMANGKSFMKKQELIDAAEASGLSRTSIAPDKSKGKPGQFASSQRDWYTGWNCMKTLISKGLVVKSSCPAKYMLTQEGQEAARDCLSRSGLGDPAGCFTDSGSHNSLDGRNSANSENLQIGQVDLSDSNSDSDSDSDSGKLPGQNCPSELTACISIDVEKRQNSNFTTSYCATSSSAGSARRSFNLRACNSFGSVINNTCSNNLMEGCMNSLAMPPRRFGEKFEEIYHVILILDDRENFGSRSSKVVDNIYSQFKVFVEVRRLPIGDGIWIARHRQLNKEYVLDFVVERKRVDDLCSSIRDNRYRDQKLRLQRCGLRKLIYLVEGDPNSSEAAESIKTACFTTEILEGFDVQRTTGFADTMRRYGYLTQSIVQYYNTHFCDESKSFRLCLSYDEFVRKCQDLEKITVRDVFALQLMQVPQVTEEVALAVTDIYPTVLSLARAYSQLEGDVRAQEEMLKNKSKMISIAASRNIFKLVWST